MAVYDSINLSETFDFARGRRYWRAVLVMCLEQCWAMFPAAGAGELRSRKPTVHDRSDSFTLTFQRVAQFSRPNGPGSEKG
jgi:hypothetical protein